MQKFVRWLNVLVIIATLLAYAAPWIDPNITYFFSFFGLLFPWLVLANIIFVIYWGIRKERYILLSIATLILGIGPISGVVGWRNSAPPSSTAQQYRILSYNVLSLRGLLQKDKVKRENFAAELRTFFVNAEQPDIFCAQEINKAASKQVAKLFDFDHWHHHRQRTTTIFSKYPIKDKGEITFQNSGNSAVWADIKLPNRTVRVFNVHLQSNRITGVANQIAKEGDLRDEKTWKSVGQMFKMHRQASHQRAKQAIEIRAAIDQSPHPVIVAGDFNDTPQSYTYGLLSRDLQDGFKERGTGIGTTFAGSLPGLRIDHILLSPELRVLDFKIWRAEFSDHYPSVCLFED